MLQFEVTAYNLSIQVKSIDGGVSIEMLQLTNQNAVHKFVSSVPIPIISNYCMFASIPDLHQFLQSPENYTWSQPQKLLTLHAGVEGSNYKKWNTIKIYLQQVELSGKDAMECENKILKKQLQYYKNKREQNLNIKNQQKKDSYEDIHSSKEIQEQWQEQREEEQISRKLVPKNIPAKTNGRNFHRRSTNGLPLLLGDRIRFLMKQDQEQSNNRKNRRIKKKLNKHGRQSSAAINNHSDLSESSDEIQSEKSLGDNTRQIKYKNGFVYRGQMKNNKFHGKGVYETDEFTYDGFFRHGQSNGRGTVYYKDGGVESGIYSPGWKRNGSGEDKYPNGQSYIGQFKNEIKNGQGTYKFENGDCYQGNFKDDLQHGKGVQYYHANNTHYQGTWVNDEKHGEGIFVSSQGKIKQIWDRGILKQEFVLIQ